MHDPLLVRCFQRVRDLARIVQRRIQRQGSSEHLAFHQFHHQRTLLDAINLRDIRMIQRSEYLGFPFEAGHTFGIARQAGG